MAGKHRKYIYPAQLLGVAVIYYAAAKLGLSLASVNKSVSPVWAPTGIAIAAALLLGYRMWPGIMIGALAANLLPSIPIATAVGIAIGNTLEGLATAYVLNWIGFPNGLVRARDVAKLSLVVLLCTMLSATIGNLSLCLSHAARWGDFGTLWLTWWLGDSVGGLVVAPLLLTWGTKSSEWLPSQRYGEAFVLVLLLCAAAMVTFGGPAPVSIHLYPLARLIVPFFLWAAFRLGFRGVTLANLTLSVFAIWGTAHGAGPFVGRTTNESLLLLQVFIGSNAVTFMFLVAAVEERRLSEGVLRQGEEQLRLALDAASMGTWNYDLRTKAVKWSANLEAIHGLTPGTFGGTFDDYHRDMHPEDRQYVLESLARTVKDGTAYAIEYRIIRPDGAVRWVEGKGQVIRDGARNAVRVTGVCMDVTKRKLAEAERAEFLTRAQNARVAAEKATESIGRLQAVTDTALQHLGLDDLLHEMLVRVRGLLATDSAAILLLSDDGQYLTVRAALGLEEAVAHEVKVPMGRGIAGRIAASRSPLIVDDLSAVEVSTSLLREKIRSLIGAPLLVEGRVLGVIHADRVEPLSFTREDLNFLELVAQRTALAIDHARLFEAEQQARIQAESANKAKDSFLAIVSHELRTPLNAIIGWCAMLQGGKLDPPMVDRAIEVISRNATVQAQLIEDILDLSRIVTGKLRLDVRSVELAQIIEAALDAVRPAANAKGIGLQCAFDPMTGPVSGDPNRLQQIVWNLLSNAVKFTPQGGEVQVQLKSVNAHVEIVVRDTGQGISAEFLPYMFDRFRQADSSTTRKYGGLGLGLAIVRHLVELHGGTIQADSAGDGQGASFVVRLPLITGVEPAHPLRATGSLRRNGEHSLTGLRVLVLDDEPDTRELLITMLSGCDAMVKATASADEALAALAEWQPDVLISDIEMPGVDGYSFIRQVRTHEAVAGGKIPAVALTAHARTEDRLRALQAGFQIHISKPVEPSALTEAVAGLTGRGGLGGGGDAETRGRGDGETRGFRS
jgi:PAS domain S-box-containing protein